MINERRTADIDVVVLCGGQGKRLGAVSGGRPKPMMEINSRPFLDIIIDYAVSFGFRRFVLCVGYKGDSIKEYYNSKRKKLLEIVFSPEKKLLGTAGAIKNAQRQIKSSPFLALNGDSLCRVDLNEFLNFYLDKKALFSLVLSRDLDRNDCGRVGLDKTGRVDSFNEKIFSKSGGGLVNAGVYLLDRSIFSQIPANKNCSMEYEIFPRLIDRGLFGFVTDEELIDIGTPERYKQARQKIKHAT